ncbi:MAG: hypothetical protein ACRDPE_15275 [Solirubrobacterales bacterium]
MRCASCGEEILTQEALQDGIVVDGDDRFHVECAPAEAVQDGLKTAEEGSWLVEWDGGWLTVESEEAGWRAVATLIANDDNGATTDDFRVVPNTPPESEDEEAEEERRREEGDVPLPPKDPRTDRFPCTAHSVAGPRPEGGPLFPPVDHDPAERRGAEMERAERDYGGRFDEDGLGY